MKKILSLLLSTSLLFNAVTICSNPIYLQASENTIDYIPLLNAVETTGNTLEFNDKTNTINIHKKDNTTVRFTLDKNTYEINGKKLELTAPLIIEEDIIYANYDDISFLYEFENDIYKQTKKQTVTNAYNLMSKFQIPGITLSLVDEENNYVWNQGFGFADIENGKTVDEYTLFDIASISKLFTALAIMQLAEEGKLDIDEKVITYIPDFYINPHPVYGGNSDEITIKMLLTHFSGIPGDILEGIYTTEGTYNDYMNNLVENLSTQYMESSHMKRWRYSNTANTLLGIIVSKLSGEDKNLLQGFSNYIDNNIFNKIGMELSSFIINEQMQEHLSVPYLVTDVELFPHPRLYFNSIPAGGMYSNAKDMSKFMNTILRSGKTENGQILTQNSMTKMLTPVHTNMPYNPELDIALTWYNISYKDFTFTGHDGNLHNFTSNLNLSTENKLGVFASGNSNYATGVIPFLTLETLSSAVNEKNGSQYTSLPVLQTNDIVLSKEQVEQYTGFYTSSGYVSSDDTGTIYFDNFDISFTPQDDGTFFNTENGRIKFQTLQDGTDAIILVSSTNYVIGEKINPSKASEDFLRWEGIYLPVSDIPNNVFIISGIEFIADVNGYPSIKISDIYGINNHIAMLEKLDDDTYYILGTSRGHGSVLKKIEKGNNTYIEMGGMTFVKKM